MISLGYSDETIATMELSLCEGIGPVLGKYLLAHFGSAIAVFEADKNDWLAVTGIGHKQAFQLHLSQQNKLKAGHELAVTHSQLGIRGTSIGSPNYPYRLKELGNGPLALYSLGDIQWNAPRIIGIVGTRKPSAAGIGITRKLVEELALYNVHVVSGLAYGIDITAHKTALDVGIPNWGVMAHGLEQVYPSSHKHQAIKMCEQRGGLISDFPAHTKMHLDYFPKRNRIVAGLCDALLVIESGVKGGSMITASIASGYNREVFAVPGRPTDSASDGCNFLIKKNMAQLTTTAKDIAEAMNWSVGITGSNESNTLNPQISLFNQLSPVEKQVMQWLLNGIQKPNDMMMQNQWSAGHISMALLDLEMKGMITTLPGNQYMSMISP